MSHDESLQPSQLQPTRLPDLSTPCLVVDSDRLDRNIAEMASYADSHRLTLRPHAKTHKCHQIARRQLDAGAAGLTVATIGEAEIFAEGGCDDLFVAYPLWVDQRRGQRLRDLADRCRIAVGIDSAEGAEAVARHAGDRVEVLVEIDSGHHRTGVPPQHAGDVATAARRAGLGVRGVFTFPGHSYGPGMAGRAADDERRALETAAAALQAVGVDATTVSGGSTPSAHRTDSGPLTEIRPGVYVFGDAQQVELRTCAFDDVALCAAATVVSRGTGRVTLDAGGKVLGADRATWSTGYGRLPDQPDARITALSEHHATVSWPEGVRRPELGAVVRVIPNHVCATVNLADELIVVSAGQVVDTWPVAARGANT